MVDPSFEVVAPQKNNPPVYRPWKETTRTWGEWRLQKRAAHVVVMMWKTSWIGGKFQWESSWKGELIWKKWCTPRKINMEPEDTLLEEENHLNPTIIFRFGLLIFGGVLGGSSLDLEMANNHDE